jgi:hypothetical protein
MILWKDWLNRAAIVLIVVPCGAGLVRADFDDPPTTDRQVDKGTDKAPGQEKKSDQPEKKADRADKKPDEAATSTPFNPLNERGFIRDFMTRLRAEVDKLPAEEKPDKRAEVQAKIVKSFGDELHGKKLTFRFPVRDVERPSDHYVVKLEAPQEIDAMGERLRFLKQLALSLDGYEARLVRPGDTVEVSGIARLAYESDTSGSATQQSLPAMFLGPDVYGKFYGVFLDGYRTKIEHR